jgi:cytochrome c oxidase assembly protein Cox11
MLQNFNQLAIQHQQQCCLPQPSLLCSCPAACSNRAITGVSTYNVVPDKAAYYFNKVQCFCFEEQRLRGGEEVDMPVFFYLDPELVEDHNCRWGWATYVGM